MLSSLAALMGMLALAAPDGLSQSAIESAYNRHRPAVCVLSYSMEITNPGSGEVSRRSNTALGLLVSADGLVMTHGHMKLDNRQPYNIQVTVGERDAQEEYDATLLEKPDDVNICFVRLEDTEGRSFPHVTFRNPGRLAVGDPFFAIGILSNTLDHARSIQTRRVGAVLEEPRVTYALDQSVSFGFVGGPAIDAQGRPVGVIGFDLSSDEGGELYARSGHPLLYQTRLFQEYIANPPEPDTGVQASPDDAYLGVFTQPLTDDLAEYWGLPKEGGIVVSTVIENSPADAAGFQSGDVITRFSGTPVTAKLDQEVLGFTKLVRESPIGQPLPVRILRDGEPTTIELSLGLRPKTAADAAEVEDETFGLTVRELTQDIRIALNLSSDVEGVVIRRVKSGSAAQLARLRPGFIIMKMGEHDVTGLESFETAIEVLKAAQPEEVTVFCRVGPSTAFFRMQPRWDDAAE